MVSTKRPYVDGEGHKKIALLDFGAKENIIRELKKRNCTVYIYPQDTPSETILENNPDRNTSFKWTTEIQKIAR